MSYKYVTDKFTSYLNQVVDFLPTLLSSIFLFVIFYMVAEYYKEKIINIKKKVRKFTKKEIQLQNLINLKNEQTQEQKQEQEQEQEQEQDDDNYNNDLIYYQLSWIIYYSIIIFGLIVSLVNLGFNVATILTVLGSVGLAMGLALQETIKNIISGVYISVSNIFKIGDIISLKPLGNLNSTYGKILDYNLYYTTILEPTRNVISVIPNSVIQNNILTNISLSRRFDLV